jgi:hypothetical protein
LALSSHKRENEILFAGTDAIYHKRNALPLNCRQPSFHPVCASFRSQDHHTLPQYNNSQSSAGNLQWNCQQTEIGTRSDSMGSSYFLWMDLTEKPSLYHFNRPLQKFSHENDITGFEHWTHRRVRH